MCIIYIYTYSFTGAVNGEARPEGRCRVEVGMVCCGTKVSQGLSTRAQDSSLDIVSGNLHRKYCEGYQGFD